MYLATILISYLIHSSCVVFAIFLLVPIFNRYKVKNTVMITVCLTIITFIILNYSTQLISLVIPLYRFERYFINSITKTNLSWFIQILGVFVIGGIGLYIVSKNTSSKNEDKNIKRIIDNSKIAYFLLLITIPLLQFDRNFHRFIEVGYIIALTIISLYYQYKQGEKESKFILYFMCIILLCFVCIIYTPYETVLYPFFKFSGFHSIFLQ